MRANKEPLNNSFSGPLISKLTGSRNEQVLWEASHYVLVERLLTWESLGPVGLSCARILPTSLVPVTQTNWWFGAR